MPDMAQQVRVSENPAQCWLRMSVRRPGRRQMEGRGCAEQRGAGLSLGLQGRFLVALQKRPEQLTCHQLPPTPAACSAHREQCLSCRIPPSTAVSAAALARLPSQIRLIVHFNKVPPLCELAVISSRWKWVLHNPDTSGMQECTAPCWHSTAPTDALPGVSV